MRISPFFLQLHTAYQAELDDLASDSEGKDVLRKRLQDKRQEMGFLLQMMETSPEMVAVIFHQGFGFPHPAVMDDLLGREADEFPEWDALAEALRLAPWAQKLSDVVLKEPMGPWFMTVAASLEYMHGKAGMASAAQSASDDEESDGDDHENEDRDDHDGEDDDARARDEAGADWLAEQGFDRKD
jgi:hypothetical protein